MEEERAPSAPPPPFPRGAAFLRAIDWRERRGRAACLGRRGGRGRRVAAPRGGDGTLPLGLQKEQRPVPTRDMNQHLCDCREVKGQLAEFEPEATRPSRCHRPFSFVDR